MSDATQETRRINWLEHCGFAHLFRAFRLAIHPTKLTLAFCGILLTYGTGRVMDRVWPSASLPVVGAATSELDYFIQPQGGGYQATAQWRDGLTAPERTGVFELLLDRGRATIRDATDAVITADAGGLVATVRSGLSGVVWLFSMHPVYGIFFFVVGLVIWAWFGGAICRVTALHATRDERIGLRESLAFAKQKWLSFLAAPLMPLLILAFTAFALFLGGLMGLIPGVGEILAGILFFLALIAGFIIAFIAIGTIGGFALMFPTVAVEGSDAFDALSRSFSYVYQRPWRSAFYGLVSVAYGAICLLFVKFFVRIMLFAVHVFVGLSMNLGSPYVVEDSAARAEDLGKLDATWQGPSLTGETPFWGGFDGPDLVHMSAFGQFWFYLWIFTVVGLVGAFVVSFYYSSSTLIYLLLRREVDATDMEDVYLDEPPAEDLTVQPTPAPEPAPEPEPEAEQKGPELDSPPDADKRPEGPAE